MHFNMLALHWLGSGAVSYRAHRLHGKWTPWVTADAEAAAQFFEYYAGAADKVFGSSIPLGPSMLDYTVREPLGVCAQIIPWNYPLRLAARGLLGLVVMRNRTGRRGGRSVGGGRVPGGLADQSLKTRQQ